MTATPTICLITAPTKEARSIASAIVEDQLAACVSVIPAVHSVYRWEGVVQTDDEALLVVKTTREAVRRIDALLEVTHPYAVYELVALDVATGNSAYLDWLCSSVLPPAG